MTRQQFHLQAAVDAGKLWIDTGAPPPAATKQSGNSTTGWSARELTVRRKFGDNEDGNPAAERFVQAGHEYIARRTRSMAGPGSISR